MPISTARYRFLRNANARFNTSSELTTLNQGRMVGLNKKTSQVGFVRKVEIKDSSFKVEVAWCHPKIYIETVASASLYDLYDYQDYLRREVRIYQQAADIYLDRITLVERHRPK